MAILQSISHDIQRISDRLVPPISADTLNTPGAMQFISEAVAQATGALKPVTSPPAPAGVAYSTIYAFGDSLTDTGNVSLATLGALPVSPPYADRSFSNGPVWVQDLAKDLGLPALQPSLAGGTDFAYGGAQTGATPVHTLNPTDLPSQYAQFTAQVSSPQPNALYTVWIGSNDVLTIANDHSLTQSQQSADVQTAVNNEVSAVNNLVARGAHDLLVLNVPDLGHTPYEMARGNAAMQSASTLSALYDQDLTAALQPLAASGKVALNQVDMFTVLNQVETDPASFGFTDVTHPLWSGNLTDPHSGTLRATGPAQSGYLFMDSLHPTAQGHAVLASGIAKGLAGTA